MRVKLLTELHLEFLSMKGGCTGSSVATLVKMPHCCKPHVAAHIVLTLLTNVTVSANSLDPDQTVDLGCTV